MAGMRDYSAEYARRIARVLRLGLSRSQARGHPRIGEPYVSGMEVPAWDRRLETGVRLMRRRGYSAEEAVAEISEPGRKVSAERLRRYLAETGAGEKRGGRWFVKEEDRRPRIVPTFSKGKQIEVSVASYAEARKAGQFMSAVGWALNTNDPSYLEPFIGEGLTDVKGIFHPFETRMNTLYRLNEEGPEDVWILIYRISAAA